MRKRTMMRVIPAYTREEEEEEEEKRGVSVCGWKEAAAAHEKQRNKLQKRRKKRNTRKQAVRALLLLLQHHSSYHEIRFEFFSRSRSRSFCVSSRTVDLITKRKTERNVVCVADRTSSACVARARFRNERRLCTGYSISSGRSQRENKHPDQL